MYLSCCVWALTASAESVIADMEALGFRWLDIRPGFLDVPKMQVLSEAKGLRVSSVAASFELPDIAELDSSDSKVRKRGLEHVEQVVKGCAAMGGGVVYFVPGGNDSHEALSCYADSLATAAESAASRDVRICIEHFPGTALPTAAETLDFIKAIDHPNLGLLFDIGHIQISGENPSGVIRQAGDRLFYVHLDDNDGAGDLHWALLDGVLTKETLRETFEALQDIGYSSAVSLELSPQLGDPFQALKRSRKIAIDCGADYLLQY